MRKTLKSCLFASLIILVLSADAAAFWGRGRSDDGVLKKKERAAATKVLAPLEGSVQLVFFSKSGKCKECSRIERLVRELSSLSGNVGFEVLDFGENAARAAALGVERAPAITILSGDGASYGISYYGLPLGYEFEAFLEAMTNVAAGTTGLESETAARLALVKMPVTITVFVAKH